MGKDRTCPHCSAPSLVWICKLLRNNEPAVYVWFCHCCKTVIDGSELIAQFQAPKRKQTSLDAKTSSTWTSSRLLNWPN
jgi:hypothetical protein